MEFGFTEEQERFRQEVRDFIKTTPWGEIADPHQTAPNYSPSFYRKVVERGWIGLAFPKEYGGQGLDPIYQTIFYEEMAYSGAPMGILLHGISISQCGYILNCGTERQKKDYLSKLARGEIPCVSQCITEPNAGSDYVSVNIRAVREGDDYIINGQKMFCSFAHGPKGGYLILLARTDPHAPLEKGASFFILPIDMPGTTTRPLKTMGWLGTNEVFFDNVRAPKQNLLGEEAGLNRGADCYRKSQYCEWEKAPGLYVATLRRAFDALVQYVKETKSNGSFLSQEPSVRQKLAELATELEVLRLLGYKQVWAQGKGLDILKATAIQSIFKDRLMVKLPHIATQILGLYGQVHGESKHAVLKGMMGQMYRDTALYLFANCGELTRKNFIASHVLGLPESHGY